jgi:hypothetical protein
VACNLVALDRAGISSPNETTVAMPKHDTLKTCLQLPEIKPGSFSFCHPYIGGGGFALDKTVLKKPLRFARNGFGCSLHHTTAKSPKTQKFDFCQIA